MSLDLELFYDVGSPYSYLAAMVVDRQAAAAGVAVRWRPFLLGGVFKATGNQPPASLPARAKYMLQDLHLWAAEYGLPFRMPSRFPLNTLLPMRVLQAAAEADRPALSRAIFSAYWADDRDVSDPAVLREVLGAPAEALLAAAETPAVKDALRAATDEAVRRGAFGAPTFFVGELMYWGNDRLRFALDAARFEYGTVKPG